MSVEALQTDHGSHKNTGPIKTAGEPPILRAEGVHLRYTHNSGLDQPVFAEFSLSLRRNEVIALVGPSGVGKSTLLHVLAGLKQPDSGRVRFGDESLRKPHPKMGVVFQDACLLPWRNVGRNVGIGLNLASQPKLSRGERKARIEAALDEVELTGSAGQMPSALSGGMAQRVAIARCLVRQPAVMLLDEPFSALDAITRKTMQSLLLKAVRHHDAAAVLVTHDIDEALRVADRVLLLQGQPAVEAGCWHLPHVVSSGVRPVPETIRSDIMTAMAEPAAA